MNFSKSFSWLDVSVFVCALGDFLVLFAPVLRQIARYLPHHRSENASKTHSKSSHDKFKTASYLLPLDEINHGGQMVAIAVQPTPSGLRTVGITGIFSFGLEQIVAFEYLMALVSQFPVPAVQKIAGKDYLVEKVPFPPVLQCPVTSFQAYSTTDYTVLSFSHPWHYVGSERFCHALVHRVVVHITHNAILIFDETLQRVYLQNRR